jgi:hypothetical protein
MVAQYGTHSKERSCAVAVFDIVIRWWFDMDLYVDGYRSTVEDGDNEVDTDAR